VDVDPIVLDNPCVHEAKLLNADLSIPYPDASFEAAVCDYVFEHIQEVDRLFGEVERILKPGGMFFFHTINRWHPLCIVDRALPRKLSAFLADRLGHAPMNAAKTHITYYRLNSRGQIVNAAKQAGLVLEKLCTQETHPVYLHLFAPVWYLGVAAERTMNAWGVFRPFRIQLYGYLLKQKDLSTTSVRS